jgi:16S rRNA processing protein RimM
MHNKTLVKMGFVRGAFGVKGWLKITANTEYADSLLDFPIWHLGKNDDYQEFEVIKGQVIPEGLVVQLKGVDTREAAHALKGTTIAVSRELFEPAEPDEYYWVDLIGLQIRNKEDILLGSVVDIMQTGAHDILVISGEYGQKLIPFVGQFVLDVNMDTKVILVDWGTDY